MVRYVCRSWGMYWMKESEVEQSPRKVVQIKTRSAGTPSGEEGELYRRMTVMNRHSER